ncbi:oligopeptidase A [Achromatium sp. WMS2]|nr:oligopeptidase A [Achromatium sp. WMS2]
MENPLLNYTGLPVFTSIQPQHVIPAIDRVLETNRTEVAELLERVSTPTWDNFVEPIDILDNRLRRTWSPVGHLNAVANSPEWREVYNACLPKLSAYSTEMGQNRDLFLAYQKIANDNAILNAAQRKALENALRDFHLSGIDLAPDRQARYKEINQRLSQLSSTFSEQVLDATQGWSKSITDGDELRGLPASAMDLLQKNAQDKNLPGWLLTLDFPAYLPIITYAKERKLRQEIYTAYVTRASDQGPNAGKWDNGPLIEEILALRHEQAQLLGFANFAELSLATKMAPNTDRVLEFLNDLASKSKPQAQHELNELTAFARSKDGLEHMEAWDFAYYSEQLQQARYAISQEELRPYFPAPKVIAGLFAVAERLFAIHIRQLDGIETWHPDVTCYAIESEAGELYGYFYLDLYARAQKRSGAWMDGCIDRMVYQGQLQIPATYLVCNFTPPVRERPSLLTHDEVQTLFHEFGHGIHHLLTKVDYLTISGTNGVAWDAVELPSQFLENWCWERESLDLLASHWQTGAPLPQDLYAKMQQAKNFQSALKMIRQLEFGLFDFQLHLEYDPAQGARVLETLDAVRRKISVLFPPEFNRLPHSFSHIFAGGYAAGYYSYKWAEVLSADAFAAFEEHGLFDPASGQAFRQHILERGGSADANELFVAFRGREPSIEPLLRHNGIMST